MKHRKVTKTMIKEIKTEIRSWYGVVLTTAQFLMLLINNEELRQDWDKFGEVETAFWELTIQAITDDCRIKANNGEWPLGKTSKRISKQFLDEFVIKAQDKGYALDEDFGYG